ncbi:peptide deformylase [Deinococcus maricopensis]|uniref:Peptide deformylase n=1 Tax=Deinococcus maricopensis (strain DSM 21211 / LMG 22137 / NRRL B-23946 / LB-34) TaxID=709986 RepID=E8U5G7_DEIML|nr:Peptide deformylase [Deinococcus maricopensis DSM 21211]
MPSTPSPNVYPIRLYGDPILRKKARAIEDLQAPLTIPGFAPAALAQVARTMLETMYDAHGVGLAAPQVGLGVRMFVAAEYADDEDEGQETPLRSRVLREFVAINPVLEVLNKKKDSHYQEGCLSIPGIYEEGVKRDRAVRMTYLNLDGQRKVVEAEDYLARVFQHEVDHLDGRFFLDRLPAEVTDDHRKDLAAMQRKAKAFLKLLDERRSLEGA